MKSNISWLVVLLLIIPSVVFAEGQYELVVTTETGDDKNAQTKNIVAVVKVNGADDLKIQLGDKKKSGFNKGAVDVFRGMHFDMDPEKIEFFELVVESGKDAWQLKKITFQILAKDGRKAEISFPRRTWFSKQRSDQRARDKRQFKLREPIALN